MKYSAKAVANYFLELAFSEDKILTPMKLQKLVYFAQGWFLAIFNKPLIHEQVEAWSYGPVIRSLYHEFKQFGNAPINSFAIDDDGGVPKIGYDDDETKRFLNRIWEVYSPYSAIQLSNMTHQENTPWKTIYDENEEDIPLGTDIPAKLIRDYFLSQASS